MESDSTDTEPKDGKERMYWLIGDLALAITERVKMGADRVTVHRSEKPDSIEEGSPSKGGVVKIHFDASRAEEADVLIAEGMRKLELVKRLRQLYVPKVTQKGSDE